jgi:hypothetical protein
MELLWEPTPTLLPTRLQSPEPIYTYEDTQVIRLIGIQGHLPTEITFGTTFVIDNVNAHKYRHIAVRCLEKRGKFSLIELVPYSKKGFPVHRHLPTYILVVLSATVKMNNAGPRMDWWNEPAYAAQSTFFDRVRYVAHSLPKRLQHLKRRVNFLRSANRQPSPPPPQPAGLVCTIEREIRVRRM